jgi:tetratricopeptide (TPR) repeat protein
MHGQARAYLGWARETMQGLDHLFTHGFVWWREGQYALNNGKWADGEKAYQHAVDISERLGDRRNWAFALINQARVAYLQGQHELAIKRCVAVYQNGLVNDHFEHQSWGLSGQALSLLQLGKITQAAALLERALSLTNLIVDSGIAEQSTQGALAVVYLERGEFEKARKAADRTARLLDEASVRIAPSFDSYSAVAYVYLSLWERAETPPEKSEMRAHARKACHALNQFALTYPIAKSRALLWQGLYEWLSGKPRSAHENWQKGLVAAREMGMPYDEALTHLEIGRHSSGVEQELNVTRANAIFERIGRTVDTDK